MTKPGYAGPTSEPFQTAMRIGSAQPTIGFTFEESVDRSFSCVKDWLTETMRDGWFLAETELDGIRKIRVWVVDETDAVHVKLRWWN